MNQKNNNTASEDQSPNRVFTYKTAADYIGASERTVWDRVDKGQLKASKIGRLVRIKQSDLDRYLDDNPMHGDAPIESD